MQTGASGELAEPLLQVRDLSIELFSKGNTLFPVLAGLSFDLPRSRITGLFGESGCGKSTLALALLGLLSAERFRVRGSIRLNGRELVGLSERQFEGVRGAEIALILQDPMLALNPVLNVRRQFWGNHSSVEEALQLAGLEPSRRILAAYPHQLSGGERQRVLIALALARRPGLIIADEPFTALDSPRVAELSALFRNLQASLGTSFLVIDHSPSALGQLADRVMVMYAGRIVEQGPATALMEGPLHPYAAALLKCLPGRAMRPIPGNPPGLEGRPEGCVFHPRCEARQTRCATRAPGEFIPEEQRAVRCFLYGG